MGEESIHGYRSAAKSWAVEYYAAEVRALKESQRKERYRAAFRRKMKPKARR